MKKLIALLLLLGMITASGCETVRGMGRDLQNTGENIRGAVGRIDEEPDPAVTERER